jgi:hypothetical protein
VLGAYPLSIQLSSSNEKCIQEIHIQARQRRNRQQLKELYKSGVLLDDLREEQNAGTITSNVTALSSAQCQEYSSSLSDTEEDVTSDKVSLVLQQRIQQHLGTENSNKNTNPGEEGEAEQHWDARIRAYSDTMANRLMHHLIQQQKGHTTLPIGRKDSSPLVPLHMAKLDFMQGLRNNTTNIDYKRVLPISLSIMILVGTSVGIIVPLMPFIAENLSLSPGDYGMVVSAFALSYFLGNLPTAILVDRHGRKPW